MHTDREGAQVEFRRDLTLMDATMIGVGAMTGASIFILAGTIIAITGSSAIFVILMNCVVTILTAMCYAELAAAFPEAGGGYLWVKESMPEPFGFISGWISWFGHTIACAFYTVVFASAIVWFLEAYNLAPDLVTDELFFKLMALIILIIFTIINYLGTSFIGKAETGITVFQLVVIAIFIIAGAYAMLTNPAAGRFSPFSKGLNPFLTAMAFLFIAFEGYEIIAQSAEEIKEPEKNLPKAIFLSIIIVTIIYMVFLGVAIGALGVDWLAQGTEETQHHAIVRAAGILIGNYGEGMLIIGLLVGTTATLNATIYSSSRVSFAMGRDGTFPAFFGKLHPKRKTPHHSILISSIIIAIIAVALPINDIVAAADVMFLVLFVLVNAAVIILRYTRPDIDRTYKVPWFPVVPIIALILKGVLAVYIYEISPVAWYITILWISVGATIHYFAGGKREIEERKDFRTLFPSIPREIDKEKYSVAVAVPPEGEIEDMIRVGSVFARRHKGPFFLLSVVAVPRTIPLRSVSYSETQAHIKRLEKAKKMAKDRFDAPADMFVMISHEIPGAISDFAVDKDVNLMILGWRGTLRGGAFSMGTNLPVIVKQMKSDVMIFKPGQAKKYRKITLFALMGSDMRFVVRTARVLAKEFLSEIKIMYVVLDESKIGMARTMFQNSKDRDMFMDLGLNVTDDYVVTNELHRKLRELDTDLLIMNYDDIGHLAHHLSSVKEERIVKEAPYAVILVKEFPDSSEDDKKYEELSMMAHT